MWFWRGVGGLFLECMRNEYMDKVLFLGTWGHVGEMLESGHDLRLDRSGFKKFARCRSQFGDDICLFD